MTIKEACDLVITAGSHALGRERSDAAVYVLEMGQPIKILDLAERLIRLSGLEPGRDVDIVYTGVRPGERLHEILFARLEAAVKTGLPGILAAKPAHASLPKVNDCLGDLDRQITANDRAAVLGALRRAVPDFVCTGDANFAGADAIAIPA
jgi:O-antigen biosynthesis protein WbqV